MDSNGSYDIKISGNDEAPKYSPTSINIKIKTRDSQHTLPICKCIPVLSLKEQIGVFTGVSTYQQQLVFRGTELRDDKLLSDYHVEDGDTIGLIVICDPPQDGGSSSGQHQGNNRSGISNLSVQETQEAVLCKFVTLLRLGRLTLESESEEEEEEEEEDGFDPSYCIVLPAQSSPVVCELPAGHNTTASDSSTRADLAHQHGHSNNNSQQTFDQSCGDHVPMPNSSVMAPENADPQYTIPPLQDSSAQVRVREHTEQPKPKRRKVYRTRSC
nr:ubiquitin-like domain-containing protein CIP73 [Ipomoea batatas]